MILNPLRTPPLNPQKKQNKKTNKKTKKKNKKQQQTNNIVFLTLKAPITTAAEDKFCDIFFQFSKKIRYDIT